MNILLREESDVVKNNEAMENQIHDNFIDIHSTAPTREQVDKISLLIPERIKSLAEEWSWSDTEVRDYIYVLIRDTKGLF